MKGKMNLYYDEEGDFLEIGISSATEGHFKNLGSGIFERIDEKTGEVMGIAIMGFKKRTQDLKEAKISLPIKIQLSA
ncbi:DUF2283 domain-containing protein [Candidatus Woesearchaeota archaeon]|nr:DUF2283 domain-containing protein [Candidatus Woesearchaeota archaeon]